MVGGAARGSGDTSRGDDPACVHHPCAHAACLTQEGLQAGGLGRGQGGDARVGDAGPQHPGRSAGAWPVCALGWPSHGGAWPNQLPWRSAGGWPVCVLGWPTHAGTWPNQISWRSAGGWPLCALAGRRHTPTYPCPGKTRQGTCSGPCLLCLTLVMVMPAYTHIVRMARSACSRYCHSYCRVRVSPATLVFPATWSQVRLVTSRSLTLPHAASHTLTKHHSAICLLASSQYITLITHDHSASPSRHHP